MSSDPKITTAVYILIAVAFIAAVTYMILYNRGVRRKEAAMEAKGSKPASTQEGIAMVTEEKERTGRTGTIT